MAGSDLCETQAMTETATVKETDAGKQNKSLKMTEKSAIAC